MFIVGAAGTESESCAIHCGPIACDFVTYGVSLQELRWYSTLDGLVKESQTCL